MLHQSYRTPFCPDHRRPQTSGAEPGCLSRWLERLRLGAEPINWVAFCLALVVAPFLPLLIVSPLLVLGGPGYFVIAFPAFAIYVGGLPYLVIGTPLLIWGMSHWGPNGDKLSVLAFLSILVLAPLVLLVSAVLAPDALGALAVFSIFAVIFAMLWAAVFASVYRKLRALLARWF